MNIMQEAYECYIKQLKSQHEATVKEMQKTINDLYRREDEAAFADVETISNLWDFIVKHHTREDCVALAKKIDHDNERPDDMVDYLNSRYSFKDE